MSDANTADPRTVDLDAFDQVLDVRPDSHDRTRIEGSVAAPLDALLAAPEQFIASMSEHVLVVCDVGMRSLVAARRLTDAGYSSVVSLAGGIDEWRRSGGALVGTGGLTEVELDRFDRQIKVPDIGVRGQSRMLGSIVTVVGAGGLGVPVISYLAGAGVGTLRIVDHDAVDRTNLHRQPLYGRDDVGRMKVDIAEHRVRTISAETKPVAIPERLTDETAPELISGSDVVVDATDNFEARYALSDAARAVGIPVVSGAVYRWEGQVTTLMPGGPCYRCVFPVSPSVSRHLDCAVIGAVGPVVATIGAVQATEALRISAGLDPAYDGTLLMYDAGSGSSVRLEVRRRADCAACGDRAG